jgi:peroxiredoxin
MLRVSMLSILALMFIAAASPVPQARAGEFNKKLNIGDKAADFSDIIGVDDKKHALADYKDAKAVVVVFTCNGCPFAKSYEDRLIALQKDYKDKGVQLVAINVNNRPVDKLDKMKERAKKKEFNFPYLYDESQKSAKDYGAELTPEVYVLDADRKIAYMGSVDDNIEDFRVKKHYVKEALDAVLAGKKPETTETKPKGCSVKYDK